MRILYADDDPFSMALICKKLQSWGYTKIWNATHGKEALELLENTNEPVIALLDWWMPELNGTDVFLHIKEQQKPKIFKILITGNKPEPSVLEKCGAQGFLMKPVDFKQMKELLEEGKIFLSEK